MADAEWNPDRYLDSMLAEIPAYPELQAHVAAATAGLPTEDVLELGIGTGETATRVLELHPNARWVGVDASEAMLARARKTLVSADLRHGRLEDPLPAGPFDLVVSALAIHHLDSQAKRALFRRVHTVLRPGGRFVVGDVVVPERSEDAQIEIDWKVDLPDSVADQLEWLRESGFDAEALWIFKDLAVFRGSRS
jgi:tRNA (cmo5U34)-methyltransferase